MGYDLYNLKDLCRVLDTPHFLKHFTLTMEDVISSLRSHALILFAKSAWQQDSSCGAYAQCFCALAEFGRLWVEYNDYISMQTYVQQQILNIASHLGKNKPCTIVRSLFKNVRRDDDSIDKIFCIVMRPRVQIDKVICVSENTESGDAELAANYIRNWVEMMLSELNRTRNAHARDALRSVMEQCRRYDTVVFCFNLRFPYIFRILTWQQHITGQRTRYCFVVLYN